MSLHKTYKNTISWDYPFKKQSEWIFEKKYTRIYFSIYCRVFTISIISLPFLQHFHRSNSIYKITTPSYGVKEEICRRMPRNFFSSAQFQRKGKSLVFFQSINFLWPRRSVFVLIYAVADRQKIQPWISKSIKLRAARQSSNQISKKTFQKRKIRRKVFKTELRIQLCCSLS